MSDEAQQSSSTGETPKKVRSNDAKTKKRGSVSLADTTAVVPQVMQQAIILDASNANIVPQVMQQAIILDASNANIVPQVQMQSIALNSKMKTKSQSKNAVPPPPPLPPSKGKPGGSGPAPPPPPDINSYLALPPMKSAQRIKIDPRELQLGGKKLKKPEEIIKLVDVERREFFDKHKNYKYIPLVDARESLRMPRCEVKSISFDGIEQLTDAFLFSLYHCKLGLNAVNWISLTGCYNVTDEGIFWLSLAFPNLKSIQLSGCCKVTEKSIYYLTHNSPAMKHLILDGTDCGVLPVNVNLGNGATVSPNFPNVTTDGCPLISPLVTEKDSRMWTPGKYTAQFRRLVILTPENLPWNPLAVLTNQNDVTPKQGLTFKQGWTPFKDHNITSVKSSAETFNVFQITRQKGLNELVLSAGSLVMLPYHLSQDMPQSPGLELASTIAAVMTKFEDCTFVLLGMCDSKDGMDYRATSEMMQENVIKYLKNWQERLEHGFRNSIQYNWRMAAFHFQEQEVLASGQHMIQQMKKLLDTDKSTLRSSYMKVGDGTKMTPKDLMVLVEAVEIDEHHNRWNRQAMMSNTVLEYSEGLQMTPFPLSPLSSVQNLCKLEGLPPRTYMSHMAKLLSYASLWGHSLYYPELEMRPVVTDFQFFADVIHKFMFSLAPRSCDLRCLGDSIPCWTHQDLMNAWPGATEEQSLLLIEVLEKKGCMMKFALDPWSSLKDVSYVYVLYKDFPAKAPAILEEYWPAKLPEETTQREKFYFCCPGYPESFFPNLLRELFKLGGPTLAWKDGALIIKGHLSVLVEKIIEFQGMPVIIIQVRGKSTPLHNEDWTILKLYATVMDMMVLKYKIPVSKTVPCPVCTLTSGTRYEVLAAKKPGAFFHEHMIRAGENRDVKCKHCSADSSVSKQLGPAIELSDLVPHHDRAGCALPTSNSLTRCLMCEHCAIDGIYCDVNLKQGLRNWCCGCEREGKLCNYCGMCQRCFMFIKKIVSTLEPVFEIPQSERYSQDRLAALDEIKVTEKGSILGLINAHSEFPLKSHALTPNYCPKLSLTIVKDGYFIMTLNNATSNWSLRYSSNTGQILENDSLIQEGDEFHACHNGETITVALQYLKGSFTEMYVIMYLNDSEIYRKEMKAQCINVTLNNDKSEGVFLQMKTDGKYLRSNSPTEKKAVKNCASAVAKFPCALEMKMYKILEQIEQVCFGGRGISLSGSACLALPAKITQDSLKYSRSNLFEDLNYRHMCLTWNPVGGKASLGKRLMPENTWFDRMSYETWAMRRLVHLIDAYGIPQKDAEVISSKDLAFIIWMWHFIVTSYPEIILPGTTSKLLHGDFLTNENHIQVQEGLRSLIRTGLWQNFVTFDLSDVEKIFTISNPGVQGKTQYLTTKSSLIQGSLDIQEVLQNHLTEAGLKQIYSKFNKTLTLYLCSAHADCMQSKQNLQDIPAELMGNYSEYLTFIDISYNEIYVLPDKFFMSLPNLIDIKIAHNYLDVIPGSIKHCKKLTSLVAMENNLTDLPEELAGLQYLSTLEFGNNRFSKIPDVVMKMTGLTKLCFPYLMLTEMPEDIGNLVNLKFLHCHGNCFTRLPESFSKLTELEELQLSGVQWAKMSANQEHVSFQEFHRFLQKKMDRWLDANGEDRNELFKVFDENSNGILDIKEVGKMNAVIFNLFPRFGYKGKQPPDDSTPHGFPVEILGCKKLKVLLLRNQGFTKVPPEISQLTELIELNLGNNPNLLSVPAEISQIKTLRKLDLDDCPSLKTPPREIRDKGFQSTIAYLERLMSGALLSKRTKLMLVGLGGAGKTSLVKALLSDENKAKLQQGEAITDGIDIQTWKVNHGGDKITYNIWDFAGQTVYYNTHQFFLSKNRAIYVLLWNVRLGHEHAGLDFWLSSISVQAPDAPIFVVGSHIDEVSKTELPVEEMKLRYPQVVGFHFISSYTGQGIAELKTDLFEVTLKQQYMGEHIPAVWLTFEKNIEALKGKNDVVLYKIIEGVANKSGIFDSSEIYQAVQFLHDLGSVQHFANEYLKANVVINPQWIVDVMACVVSVKSGEIIQNGRLEHSDIDKIWSAYPKTLRGWLLRLTEEFDLTFPLKDEPVSLVPCLLPEKKPEFVWTEIEKGSDLRESKMVYTFDYLPAGLFNRAQVRLHNLSDKSLIWKKGSFLVKNVHKALIQQTKDTELVVLSHGPRPENIQFLVHEVFEGLIAESFNGIAYDFTMPCPECQRMFVKDPHMFAASTIRRALDMKAPFLQCIKYFHTISCANLQTLLPPDSHGDFDAHLVECVQGLKDLHKDLAADIFISHCQKDMTMSSSSYILPARVYGDLVNKGFRCWYQDSENSLSTDEMAKALIDSSVFLAFVSANYANDVECVNFFKYARLILRKAITVVAIGDGFEWKQSKLGILLSDEVFINMTKQKYEYYDSKFEELLKALAGKTRVVADVAPKPAVFFSYTWVNSAQAVALGTREVPGAIGYGDPRELKDYLEQQGIACWIDVERVGMNGLFDDIAEGLLCAKVVIVCVSDEYASSPTCQLEFRYAANTLKLPVIMAVVGTGDNWRAMEVGLMSVQYPIVNFQEKTKNARKKLLNLIKEVLSNADDVEVVKEQKNKTNEGHKNLSYQELFELAQRKLLRQLIMYAENQDLDVYPRLFVLDFIKDQEEEEEKAKIELDNEHAKEMENEKVDTDQEKRSVSRASTVHKTLTKKTTSVMLPAYRMQRYQVYTLCEHDEGWHSVAPPIELDASFGVEALENYGPYLSRMITVMKYNKKMALNIFGDDIGEAFIDWLEKSPEASMSDYQNVYHSFREMVKCLDTELVMGKLSRCHLNNGKTIWLCDQHRDSMRVTCISNEDKTSVASKEGDKVTNWMLAGLRSMDHTDSVFKFKSVGNGPRLKPEKHGKERKHGTKQEKKRKQHHDKHSKTLDESEDSADEDVEADDDVDSAEKDVTESRGSKVVDRKKPTARSLQSTALQTGAKSNSPGTKPVMHKVRGEKQQVSEISHQAGQQQSDTESVTSEKSVSSAAGSAKSKKQRRPLPGQSQYKPPTYKQTSRTCEIS